MIASNRINGRMMKSLLAGRSLICDYAGRKLSAVYCGWKGLSDSRNVSRPDMLPSRSRPVAYRADSSLILLLPSFCVSFIYDPPLPRLFPTRFSTFSSVIMDTKFFAFSISSSWKLTDDMNFSVSCSLTLIDDSSLIKKMYNTAQIRIKMTILTIW